MDLTEAHIDTLEAQRKRVDLAVETDFVLSVLPNGIKTWAHVYDHQGQLRRKTLGVYPDMGIDEARDALRKARKTMDRLKNVAAHASPARVPPTQPVAADGMPAGRLAAVAASGLAVLLLAGWYVFYAGRDRPDRQASTAVSAKMPAEASQGSNDTRAAGPARQENPGAGKIASSRETPTEPIVETADPGNALTTAQTDLRRESSGTAAIGDTRAVTAAPAKTEVAASSEAILDARAESPVATLAEALTSQVETVVEAPEETLVAAPVKTPVVPPVSSAAAAAPVSPATVPAGVQILSDKVARAVLTSGIVEREPVDALGQVVAARVGEPGDVLYFFTDVRGMSGSTVTHRWQHEGQTVARRDMRIGGWRWRMYSSRDVVPGMEGNWTASLLDADGQLLASYGFELRLEGADTAAYSPD